MNLTKLVSIAFVAMSFIVDVNHAGAQTTAEVVFSEGFDTEEDFNRWTVINVEEGSTTWTYRNSTGKPMQSKCAQILKHTPNRAEDWLISPGFSLETGNVYELSFRMSPGTFNKEESMKAYLGTGVSADDMATLLISIENVMRDDNADITYRIKFSPTESGTHYLGFLACSAPDMGRIDLDDITVTPVSSQKAPGTVSGLSAVAGERGKLEAILSFRAPTVDAAGEWLESITTVNIYRGTEKIGTIESPKPGSALTYPDTGASQGVNSYSVTASNSAGEGEPSECTVFVGMDVPVAVAEPRAVYSDGKIKLTWQVPSASVNGGWFDPEALQYFVSLAGEDTPLVSLTGTTEYEYDVPDGSEQRVYEFSIKCQAEAGESDAAYFNRLVAGSALTTPFRESFAGGVLSSPWFADSDTAGFEWIVDDPSKDEYSDPEIKDYTIYPYDADGGDLIADCYYSDENDMSRFVSPIFDLEECAQPVLRYALLKGPTDQLKVQIRWNGGEWEALPEAEWDETVAPQLWQECMVPIVKQAGKTAQFSFLCTGGGRPLHIDDIRIEEAGWTRDLKIDEASVSPKRASIGETSRFDVTVRNLGNTTESEYILTLLRDGEIVATANGPEVAPSEFVSHTFEYTATYDDQYMPKSSWTVRIDGFDADERADNDVSEPMEWSVRENDVPVPTGLTAVEVALDDYVRLTWDEATDVAEGVRGNMITVIDSFEDYEPFLKDEAGEWTIVDRDGAATWNTAYPYFAHKGEPMAFQVFNTEQGGVQTADNLDNIFFAHSGKQYMLCVSNADLGIPNDDWLITPRLDGRAQTVKFYCSTPQVFDSPDRICVGYSTTDTDPDSFTMLGDGKEYSVWDGWGQQYEFDIPEGARYFAINVVSCAMFVKVDDVCYARHDGQPDPLTVIGYNVYRDGRLLNAEPLAEAAYDDPDVVDGSTYVYKVTTVYEQGESPYSDAVEITTGNLSGIDAVAVSDGNIGFKVVNGGIETFVSGELCVFSVDGKKIAVTDCAEGYMLPLEPGIYIVAIGGNVNKVVVR